VAWSQSSSDEKCATEAAGGFINTIRQRLIEGLLLSLPKRPDILAIQLGASFILLVLLAGVMFLVPPLHVAVTVTLILTVVYFFTRPMLALFSIFCARAILDLLWWIPGTIAGLNMLQLFSAAVFVLVATQLFLDLKRAQQHPCFNLLLVYLALIGLAALRSQNPLGNVDNLVRYIVPIILFFMISIHFNRRGLRKSLMLVIAVIGIIPLVLSLYHMSQGQMNAFTLHGYTRLLGAYKNLHNMALMSLFFVSLWVFWLMQTTSRFKRAVLLILILLGTLAMYKSYIRTAVLGFTVFLGAIPLLQKRYRILITAAGTGALLVTFSPDIQDRFSDILLIFDTGNVMLDKRALGSGRWGIWTMSMKEFLSRPSYDLILGAGLGEHRAMTENWVKMFHKNIVKLDPHNDMLLLLYQIGPLGVLAYLGLQWKVFVVSRKLYLMENADRFSKTLAIYTGAMTIMVFVANIVSNSFIHRTSPGWYYWCICGLMVAEYANLKRDSRPIPGRLSEVPDQRSNTAA
jgi:hypothetical protein